MERLRRWLEWLDGLGPQGSASFDDDLSELVARWTDGNRTGTYALPVEVVAEALQKRAETLLEQSTTKPASGREDRRSASAGAKGPSPKKPAGLGD
jgi:hypothetical protein